METEEQIIYSLLDTIRNGLINNDEVISERLLRSYLRESRAFIIRSSFKEGYLIFGEEFQSLGDITLNSVAGEITYDLPRLIRLPNNASIRLTTVEGYVIPVLSKQDVQRSVSNPVTMFQPKAHIEGSTLSFYPGAKYPGAMRSGSGIHQYFNSISSLKAHLECVLYSPDDLVGYDWTKDPFPISAELLAVVKNNVLKKDLSVLLSMKTDQVTNMKQDQVRYHDEGKID